MSGRIYLRARYYDPVIGRMLAEDPYWNVPTAINDAIVILQRQCLYSYCISNPVRYMDSTGYVVETLAGLGALENSVLVLVGSLIAYNGSEALKEVGNTLGVAIKDFTASASAFADQVNEAAAYFVAYADDLAKAVDQIVADTLSGVSSQLQTSNHTVYVHYDKTTRKVHYVGRTNNYARRYAQHSRYVLGIPMSQHPILGSTNRDMMPVATGLTQLQARVMENYLILAYTLGALDNARREIAKEKWPKALEEFNRAYDLTSDITSELSNPINFAISLLK